VYDLGGNGWGNNELETYTSEPANASVAADAGASDGKALYIRALKTASGGYTSARIKTLGKFAPIYGRIEARARLANGQGIWPAFWMLGSNISSVGWPACGEIDIIESINAAPKKVYGTLHGPGYSGDKALQGTTTLSNGTLDQAYHVYAVDWSSDKIVWSFDGAAYYTVTPATLPAGSRWVFNDNPFFLLLNLAVGGNWPGSPDGTTAFPQTFAIDYVRVYSTGLSSAPAPAELGAFAVSPAQVTLTWLPPTGLAASSITGYQVERATDAQFTQNLASADAGRATSYTDASVAGGTQYFYRVRTRTSDGLSVPTAAQEIHTPAASASGSAHFANIATRAFCDRGNNVTIGGFVVSGTAPMQVLVRAVGPTLADVGVPAADILRDPVMKVFRGGTVIATNDDWTTNANVSEMTTTGARIGALAFNATDKTSAALLLTLPPAVYSFVTYGKDNTSGIVLVEAYDAN
jgi:beta-glucanase (GH16 family)